MQRREDGQVPLSYVLISKGYHQNPSSVAFLPAVWPLVEVHSLSTTEKRALDLAFQVSLMEQNLIPNHLLFWLKITGRNSGTRKRAPYRFRDTG